MAQALMGDLAPEPLTLPSAAHLPPQPSPCWTAVPAFFLQRWREGNANLFTSLTPSTKLHILSRLSLPWHLPLPGTVVAIFIPVSWIDSRKIRVLPSILR